MKVGPLAVLLAFSLLSGCSSSSNKSSNPPPTAQSPTIPPTVKKEPTVTQPDPPPVVTQPDPPPVVTQPDPPPVVTQPDPPPPPPPTLRPDLRDQLSLDSVQVSDEILNEHPVLCSATSPCPAEATSHDAVIKQQINATGIYTTNHASSGEPLSGDGITVAVMDSGLGEFAHPEMDRVRVRQRVNQGGRNDSYILPQNSRSDNSHGTRVAGVIGAARDNQVMHGVAPQVGILMERISFATDDLLYISGRIVDLIDNLPTDVKFINLSFGYIAGQNQVSLGIDNPRFDNLRAGNPIPDDLAFLAPLITGTAQNGVPDKRVLVWAAGNSRYSPGTIPADYASPGLLAGLPVKFPALRGHWLAVIGVNPTNLDTTSFRGPADNDPDVGKPGHLYVGSTSCGSAKDFCLAAPAACILMPSLVGTADYYYPNQSSTHCSSLPQAPAGYTYSNGTSFAAPMVVGALALMQEAFPGLTAPALVTRLLATADKTDHSATNDGPDYSNQEIYGQGLLDVGAAVSPVGTLSLQAPDGRQLSPQQAALTGDGLPQAMYAALASGLGDREVMLLDSLGAPFWHTGAAVFGETSARNASFPPAATPVAAVPLQLLGNSNGFLALGTASVSTDRLLGSSPLHRSPTPLASPWMGLLADRPLFGGARTRLGGGFLSLALGYDRPWISATDSATTHTLADPSASKSLAAAQYRFAALGGELAMLSGSVREKGTLLGLDAAAMLAEDADAQTAFAGLEGRWRFGRHWHFNAAWQQARTRLRTNATGLLQHISGLQGEFARLTLAHSSLLSTSDVLSLSAVHTDAMMYGRAEWLLPASLSNGKVQYRRVSDTIGLAAKQGLQLDYSNAIGRRRASCSGCLSLHGRLSAYGEDMQEAALATELWQLSLELRLGF